MKNIIYITLFLLVSFSSCTAPINILVDDAPPKFVVYAVFDQMDEHKVVKLSSTAPFFGDKTPKVSNAMVYVESSEGDRFLFEEEPTDPGTYYSEVKFGVKIGVKYDINITVDFDNDGVDEVYKASSTVQSAFPIDSIVVSQNNMMGNTTYATNLYAKDSKGKNSYLAKIIINDELATKKITEYSLFNNELLSGSNFNGIMIYMFMDEKHRDDFDDKQQQDIIFVQAGDKITCQISKIEESYLDFLHECKQEYEGENPIFGGPPSNISTNISNGAIGYFATHYTQLSNSFTIKTK